MHKPMTPYTGCLIVLRRSSLLLAVAIFSFLESALGATYQIDFWAADQISLQSAPVVNGVSLPNINHPDYRVLAEPALYRGTFSIADSALGTSDGFISLTSPAFLSFNLTIEDVHFELPGDPLRLCGYIITCQPENNRLGIRLDHNGAVQRFDIPSTFVSNGDSIIDTDYDISQSSILHPQLVLVDQDPQSAPYFALDDTGNLVVIPANTARDLGWLQLGAGPSGDDLITPLGRNFLSQPVHVWDTFNWPRQTPAHNVGCASCAMFAITPNPVPIPSAVVLFGSSLIGILALNRRISR